MQQQRSQHQSIGYVAINILFFFFFYSGKIHLYIIVMMEHIPSVGHHDQTAQHLEWRCQKEFYPFSEKVMDVQRGKKPPTTSLTRRRCVYDSPSWWSEEGEEPRADHRVDAKLSFCASAASEWACGTGCAAQSHRCGAARRNAAVWQPDLSSSWRSGSKKEENKAHSHQWHVNASPQDRNARTWQPVRWRPWRKHSHWQLKTGWINTNNHR